MWCHQLHFNVLHLVASLTFLISSPASLIAAAADVEPGSYEFIIVGAGAGGGPLAARLAMAGHKTLLIDAGDDPGTNVNFTVPAYAAKSSEDETAAWNFFVRYYADDEQQARNYKTTYETSDGRLYTGLHPPAGARMLGILYPRAGALGGCTVHNTLMAIYPNRQDFDNIAELTEDGSWSADHMRIYFERMTRRGWMSIVTAPLSLAVSDMKLLSVILGGASACGGTIFNKIWNLINILTGDINAGTAQRDVNGGYFLAAMSARDGKRVSARDFIVSVRDARNQDGSQKYPLDVRTNCHVTRVIFDESGDKPRATGVEFLDGAHLYRASPRSKTAAKGVHGSAIAKLEVIIAGGVYNSPQILKLSGIGPADELSQFGIKVIKDLPGVGTNLQDHYEVAVQGRLRSNFSALDGCTFSSYADSDSCLQRWEKPGFFGKGIYGTNGVASVMLLKSSASSLVDMSIFGGPADFRGYFPDYSVNLTAQHNLFTWVVLRSHPHNRGSVTLQSADPLDMPKIIFNYFNASNGSKAADLQAIREGVKMAREAFRRQTLTFTEILPGSNVQSDGDIDAYAMDTAWGHHASSTCPIGPDSDPMAVLDSSFRVRGVRSLRVVDGSVFPQIPGTFPAISTYMVGEKAADVILSEMR